MSPFNATFEFRNVANSERRAQVSGWVSVVGALLKDRHPELDFSIVSRIIFTDDLVNTVRESEALKMKNFPLALSLAEEQPIFAIIDGDESQLVVISSVGPFGNEAHHKAWYFVLAAELAFIDYSHRLLKTKLGKGLGRPENVQGAIYENVSIDIMASYWRGYFGMIAEAASDYPFDLLALEISNTKLMIEETLSQYSTDANVSALSDKLLFTTKRLTCALALLLGYLENAKNDSLSESSYSVEQIEAGLISLNASDLRDTLALRCRTIFASRKEIEGVKTLYPLAECWWQYLLSLGLHYTFDGNKVIPHYRFPDQPYH